ncbi:DUF4190 domain-containing protein [Mycolicibacterium sp. CR10]|uniref:DUF4190 domain-containing protein n=1 Tax=Mycolicibacterium sp. CR10 TaxID=2562314 RepID=UPI0010BFB8FF|nr:DUF4190 domain-containing protein [Mycolicibacterium sp. CR10]
MSEPPPPPQYGAYPGGYPPQPGGYPPPPGGYQPPPGGYPPPVQSAPKNGLGVASLVVAIISLFSVFGGVVLGVVAVILGYMGRGRAKRGEATNGGIAMAGIVLGFLSIIVSVAAIGIMVWGFDKVGGTDYVDCVTRAGNDQQAVQDCAKEFTDRVEDQFSITVTPTP